MLTCTLKEALDAAIDAARAVGPVLRDDFHRAPDHKATKRAEIEAETILRDRLLAACPAWGFRGEETGAQEPREGEATWWLVDPLDGTSDHEAGARGGAVSIGAVRDGVPVLGVVYAFAAPDDEGDLLAWAEGCGPLQRNGRPVEVVLPQALTAADVVLVSWKGEEKPETNMRIVEPARFRAVPSIAYRLALVAAGEAAAGVSVNGPCGWDYAGGHALVRAVGGDLIDQDGRLVRYDAQGISHTSRCFGGRVALARALAQMDWGAVYRGSSERMPTPAVRGESTRDAGLLARAQGCLLGQLAGDSLGSLVEFKSPQTIAQMYPQGVRDLKDGGVWGLLAGQPTDDSELALALARTLVSAGEHRAEDVALAYVAWLKSPPFDIGFTTRKGLEGAREGAAEGRAAEGARAAADWSSKSNGSLMRISPLAIFGHALPADRVAALARQDSLLTHPNPACADACAVLTVAAAHAIRTGDGPREVYRVALAWAEANACPEVVGWLRDAAERLPEDYCHHQGFVRHGFVSAFHHMLHAGSVEEAVVRTVMGGGDTDTNAAIVGALMGAVHGREGVPERWRRAILSCHPAKGTLLPRPRTYWPADALALAERLLAVGARHAGAPGRESDE